MKIEKELKELLDDDSYVLIIFNLAQEIVQTCENQKEAEALNIITGSSFALYHAIQHYKEVKYGKSVSDCSGFTYSKNGS